MKIQKLYKKLLFEYRNSFCLGYFYQGNEKQTRATLKGHYCLYYLTMRLVYRTEYRNSVFLGGGGGGAYYNF